MPNNIFYKIKDAVQGRSQFDLSSHVNITNDFGYLLPVMCQPVVPTDSFRIATRQFFRTSNLPFPTDTHVSAKVRHFFVRMRNIWSGYDSYYHQLTDDNGDLLYDQKPSLPNNSLVAMLIASSFKIEDIVHNHMHLSGKVVTSPIQTFQRTNRFGITLTIEGFFEIDYLRDFEHNSCSFIPYTPDYFNRDLDMSVYRHVVPSFVVTRAVAQRADGSFIRNLTHKALQFDSNVLVNLFDESRTDRVIISAVQLFLFSEYTSEFLKYIEGSSPSNIADIFLGFSPYVHFENDQTALYREFFPWLTDMLSLDSNDFSFSPDMILDLSSGVDVTTFDYSDLLKADDPFSVDTRHYACHFDSETKHLFSTLTGIYDTVNLSTLDSTLLDFLPCLALARIIYDHFIPQEFEKRCLMYPYFGTNNIRETYTLQDKYLVIMFLRQARCVFDADYFTSAWNTPLGYSPLLSGVNPESTVDRGLNIASYNNPQFFDGTNSLISDGNIDSQSFKSLQRISDWLLSRSLLGPRLPQLYKLAFGVDLPDTITNMSRHLATDVCEIQISDMNATADSTNGVTSSTVGDYAGKAIGYSGDQVHPFTFDSDDFGFILSIQSIIPQAGYYQGRRNSVTAITPDREFNAEQDALGSQIIRYDELFSEFYDNRSFALAQAEDIYRPDLNFGYCPRYSPMKIGYDKVIGDYRLPSRNIDIKCHFQRRDFDFPSIDNPLAKNLNFLQIDPNSNGSQFDNMFMYHKDEFDHFYGWVDIMCHAVRPMLAISDSLPWLEDNATNWSVSGNGQSMTD